MFRHNWKQMFAKSKWAAISHWLAKTFHLTISRFLLFVPAGSAKKFEQKMKRLHTSSCILGRVKFIQNRWHEVSLPFLPRGRTQVEAIPKSALVTPLPGEKKLWSPCCDGPLCHEELKHLHKPNNTVDVLERFQKHFWNVLPFRAVKNHCYNAAVLF